MSGANAISGIHPAGRPTLISQAASPRPAGGGCRGAPASPCSTWSALLVPTGMLAHVPTQRRAKLIGRTDDRTGPCCLLALGLKGWPRSAARPHGQRSGGAWPWPWRWSLLLASRGWRAGPLDAGRRRSAAPSVPAGLPGRHDPPCQKTVALFNAAASLLLAGRPSRSPCSWPGRPSPALGQGSVLGVGAGGGDSPAGGSPGGGGKLRKDGSAPALDASSPAPCHKYPDGGGPADHAAASCQGIHAGAVPLTVPGRLLLGVGP